MVKITGNTKGGGHLKSHLEYIAREDDEKKPSVVLENHRGEKIFGKDGIAALRDEWMADAGRRRKNTRDTTNVVLSMPPGTDRDKVTDAVRSFASKRFAHNYQYVFAQHNDEKHAHVHLTIKTLGHDGRRLHVKRGDPQVWREEFAEELRSRGVDAEATPRAVRGVVRKPTKQAVLQMRKRGAVPRTDRDKVAEAIAEVNMQKGGQKPPQRPWEDRIKERQTKVRKTWLTAAKELAGSEKPEDRALAKKVAGFVKDMPPLETERHALNKQVVNQVAKEKPQQRSQDKGRDRGQQEEDER
ncbi:relaxase/mobilization nuclease domain-containing protein (plasmid) [Guyparkeria sp. 1SP6A2]|nr:relaxase/mobilization nuclease domain-containing protein [Guyparkeria sp. 1SP6A2]